MVSQRLSHRLSPVPGQRFDRSAAGAELRHDSAEGREVRSQMKTRAVLMLLLLLIAGGTSEARAQSAVLISEMCDPHLNYATDRFIEIYNAGGSAVDLTDWSLVAVGNGGDVFTWPLSGTIDPGEALVAGDYTTTVPFQVDFPEETWSNNNSLWNGKVGDGAKLLNASSIVVDYAVVEGTAFENEDYVRNYGVIYPTTTYDALEWTATPVEYPTDGSPGTHSSAPPIPGPSVSNILTAPAAPVAGDTVLVYADVSDTLPISSVTLMWGTSQFTFPNEIQMSVHSGDTYVTDSAIPAQSSGTSIYFKIEALNNLSGLTLTDTDNYSIPFVLSISQVQGTGASSPYDGYAVITHGVVTGSFGSYFSLQDGSGAWSGVWCSGSAWPSVGDSLAVRGTISENASAFDVGNTLITYVSVESSVSGVTLPAPLAVTTLDLVSEQYEGVLVSVEDAVCTNAALGSGEWEIDDGTGAGRVDDLGYSIPPVLGTTYDVTGPLFYRDGDYKVEPRDASDVVWVTDGAAPSISQVFATSETEVLVTFSEEVEEVSAELPFNYSIEGLTVSEATRDAQNPNQTLLIVSVMTPGDYTLVVDGVEDLYANAADSVSYGFDYVDISIPAGYYDSAEGLLGDALRLALHNIIDGHTPVPYADTWISFMSTDDKPNGKVWDIYSDVPGGTPPYEYTFGVDQGGVGGVEGTGYNREHSWPSSWFGGGAPMESDLFVLYPTDNFVNNQRGSEPYGEIDSPTWTSLNGSKKGTCDYPGYAGVAFEPIDEYKGDLARSYFYMTTRYYTEDATWSTSAMTDGADLLPWAVNLLLEWHVADPVSRKELERNGTIYGIQSNRNPFIDRPEFAAAMYVTTGLGDGPVLVKAVLSQNAPNPFNPVTTIRFGLSAPMHAEVRVFDLSGRLVRDLCSEDYPAGDHELIWDGTDSAGVSVGSGVYFYALRAGDDVSVRKMVMLK